MDNIENNPFQANEIRFYSIKTIPKFIIRGVPRILFILISYLIIFLFYPIFVRSTINFQNSLIKYFARFKLFLFGYKNINIDAKSLQLLKNNNSQIFFCNHSSYIDIGLLLYLIPNAKFIASEFMSKIPIVNNFAINKCIYLKNEFGGNLTSVIAEELKKGAKIIFFSEGVCKKSDFILKLRNGAFVPKLNILPIHIEYEKDKNWVMGEQDMIHHILWQISQGTNKVKIKVAEEYKITEEDKGDIEIFKENFRKYYAKEFGVKLSEKSYKDHPYYKHKI